MKNLKQLQLVLSTIFIVVVSLTGYGQNVGDEFTVDDIKYKIASPTAVEIVDYTGTATEMTIPQTVTDQGTDFVVNDIQITNARVNTLKGSGFSYIATIIPTSLCDGDIIIDVPANVTMGANNLPNMEAPRASVATVTFSERCESKALVGLNRGFSPNGDGIADTLVIQGLEKYGNNVVKIYNLNQQLLFSGHYEGSSNGWDGTYKGSLVSVGSYVCVIDYNELELRHETKMIYVNY